MVSNQPEASTFLTDALAALAMRGLPISIHYCYKGVSLCQPLKILALDDDRLVLQAPSHKVCYILKKEVILYSPTFTQAVVARMEEMNPHLGWLMLSNLAYTGTTWFERSYDRVQPDEPLYAFVRGQHEAFSAMVENISIQGVGLLAYSALQRGIELTPGDTLVVDLHLPPGDRRVSITGKIANLTLLGNRMVRIGVSLQPGPNQVRWLKRYIDQRSQEIAGELDEYALRLFEPRMTKDLYF